MCRCKHCSLSSEIVVGDHSSCVLSVTKCGRGTSTCLCLCVCSYLVVYLCVPVRMSNCICLDACQFRRAADTQKTSSKRLSAPAQKDKSAAQPEKQRRESRRRFVDGRNQHSSVELRHSKSAQTMAHVCTEPYNVDWVEVLRPTWHKTGHFRDVLPSQSFGVVLKKLNPTQSKANNTRTKIV